MATMKKTVLIIEDDVFLTNIYATKFGKSGYNVVLAENGEVGIKRLDEVRPDIILLDILMPKMNGFDFLEALKIKPSNNSTPVILLTNLSQKDDVKRGLALGATDFLIKAHFMPSEVVAKVESVLSDLPGNKKSVAKTPTITKRSVKKISKPKKETTKKVRAKSVTRVVKK